MHYPLDLGFEGSYILPFLVVCDASLVVFAAVMLPLDAGVEITLCGCRRQIIQRRAISTTQRRGGESRWHKVRSGMRVLSDWRRVGHSKLKLAT